MATPDLSGMSILHLLYEVANEFSEVNLDDIHAELSRRMTPPPGCVRLHSGKDLKVMGTSEEGWILVGREAAEAARSSKA